MSLKRTPLYMAVAAGLALNTQLASAITLVTNGDDSGEGSLRAALELASSNPAALPIIVSSSVTDIQLSTTLDYTGERPLVLFGSGQAVNMPFNQTILQSSTGASMRISGLDFIGPGGFDINNRGDLNGEVAGKGIFIDVADEQVAAVQLVLNDVTVQGVANHGIHVSDCNLADDCGGGGGGAGEGSAASIVIALSGVTVADAGNGRFDADGLRVDERGIGNVTYRIFNSTFVDVGADGIELDEGQDGSVTGEVAATAFIDNGAYCDPALLEAYLPVPDEAEFEEGEATDDDIPGPVTGSPDDRCFEREVSYYDSGAVESYEFGIDVDDAFDIDEAGMGSIKSAVVAAEIVGNYDEGLDFDEEDQGNIILIVDSISGENNTDDAVKLSEKGMGGVTAIVSSSDIFDNDGKGLVFEEADAGNLDGLVFFSELTGNDDGETQIEAVQEDAGTGTLVIELTNYEGEIETDGVELIE